MTMKEYLTGCLQAAGEKGRIYDSMKDLKHAQGVHYAAILRTKDEIERAKRTRYHTDGGVEMIRKKRIQMETTYNVVIASQDEDTAAGILNGFLLALGKGFDDGDSNWVDVEAPLTDWVDEEDSVLKAKVAVQVQVIFRYGLYTEEAAGSIPESEVVAVKK